MDKPSSSIHQLAKQLLTLEAATSGVTHAHEAVWRKLGVSLTRFAGAEGSTSLLRRAFALARAEAVSLQNTTLAPDGSLQGLDADALKASKAARDGVVVITAHLLGLLVSFIGESLMLRLVREAWPSATLGEEDFEREVVP